MTIRCALVRRARVHPCGRRVGARETGQRARNGRADHPACRTAKGLVYATKAGHWNPDLGDLELPEGWEFLPSGDAFVTRQVKAAGTYWTAWQPRSRNCPHRRKLGFYAPASAIEQAQAAAEHTAERRTKQRAGSARYRERVEDDYRAEFTAAVVAWLGFAAEHAALAKEIALRAAERAVVVGSGRVGRTRMLPLEERVALAARATIRHHLTGYEDRLADLDPFETEIDDSAYRDIRRDAHGAVDAFLDARRQGDPRA